MHRRGSQWPPRAHLVNCFCTYVLHVPYYKSLVTTRPRWISGLEMTMVAVIAGAITYGLGVAFAIN